MRRTLAGQLNLVAVETRDLFTLPHLIGYRHCIRACAT